LTQFGYLSFLPLLLYWNTVESHCMLYIPTVIRVSRTLANIICTSCRITVPPLIVPLTVRVLHSLN